MTYPSAAARSVRKTGRAAALSIKFSRFSPYIAISPFVILFAIFSAYPLIYGVWLSLQSWNGFSDPSFVGLDNFATILNDSAFWKAAGTTLIIFAGSTVPMLLVALAAALAVGTLRGRLRKIVETILISPVVVSIVAASLIFQALFSQTYGLVDGVLQQLGLPSIPWLTSPAGIQFTIVLMIIWRNLGYFTIIFLAGIATVPSEILEAGRLDGASGGRLITSIILPSLRPVIIFCVLTASVSTFQTFAEPQVLVGSTGGTGRSGLTLMLYQFASSFQPGSLNASPQLGYASAVGWIIFLMLVVLSLGNWLLLRRFGQRD